VQTAKIRSYTQKECSPTKGEDTLGIDIFLKEARCATHNRASNFARRAEWTFGG